MQADALRAAATRRRFLLSSAALATAPLVGCGGGGDSAGANIGRIGGIGVGGDDDPVAATASGSYRGRKQDGVTSWLGIPYAQPPVGPLRFQSPRPVRPATGVVDAAAFGAASLQTVAGMVSWIYPSPDLQSEDCLTLNVWRPSEAQRLPVIVWFHGGGFRTGATGMPLMNGKLLAQRGVVVVTANYRLG